MLLTLFYHAICLKQQEKTEKNEKVEQDVPPDRQSAAPTACGLSAGELSRSTRPATQDKKTKSNPTRPKKRQKKSRDQMHPKAYFRFLAYTNTHYPGGGRRLDLTAPYPVGEKTIKTAINRFTKSLTGNWIWRIEHHRSGRIHVHMLYWNGPETRRQLRSLWAKALKTKPGKHIVNIRRGGVRRYFIKRKPGPKGPAKFSIKGHWWGHKRGIPEAKLASVEVPPSLEMYVRSALARYLPPRLRDFTPYMTAIYVFGPHVALRAIFDSLLSTLGYR